ncbi:MAG: DUF262 domain-containing protein [Treponema sp.]|nr:DUF262 domain-containing protein [Treponema sp.]
MERQLHYGEASIYEVLEGINSGKYVMPAFQRQYVWNMERIEKLWDSILCNYPISTFLFWHLDESNTTDETYFCTFMKKMLFKRSKKEPGLTNYSTQTIDINVSDTAVVDGQQRLTSLYLSLFGEVEIAGRGKNGFGSKLYIELDKNKVDTDSDEVSSKTYGFEFTDKIQNISPTRFEVKKLLDAEFRRPETRLAAIREALKCIPNECLEYAGNIIWQLCSKIYDEKVIRYSEIYGMLQDDALEMFVRFNDGGKQLTKSDITMAIFDVYWPLAKSEFGFLLQGTFRKYKADFIVRTALMLYGDVSKSCIDKKVADSLKNNWSKFCRNLDNLQLVLRTLGMFIDDFYDRWNVVVPVIFLIDRNPDFLENIDGIRCYLFRAMFFTYFQNGTTAKLSKLRSAIAEFDFTIQAELLDEIPELAVNEQKIEDVLNAEKGNLTSIVLNVLYANRRVAGASYDQDHIHPKSNFDREAPAGITDEQWREWHRNRDRLPNLQLLDKYSNQFKSDMPLIEFYNSLPSNEQDKFRSSSFIPSDVSLEIKSFGEFYEKRKALLKERIKDLLLA